MYRFADPRTEPKTEEKKRTVDFSMVRERPSADGIKSGKFEKSQILSTMMIFEWYLCASRRALMPWRALRLTKLKYVINVETFGTLNQSHVSENHEKNSKKK